MELYKYTFNHFFDFFFNLLQSSIFFNLQPSSSPLSLKPSSILFNHHLQTRTCKQKKNKLHKINLSLLTSHKPRIHNNIASITQTEQNTLQKCGSYRSRKKRGKGESLCIELTTLQLEFFFFCNLNTHSAIWPGASLSATWIHLRRVGAQPSWRHQSVIGNL